MYLDNVLLFDETNQIILINPYFEYGYEKSKVYFFFSGKLN